VQELIWKHLNH